MLKYRDRRRVRNRHGTFRADRRSKSGAEDGTRVAGQWVSGIGEHARAVAAAVRRHPGGVVLVVGHQSTVPAIIEALGGPHLPDIRDPVFDNLFILVPSLGRVRLVRSRYGEPTPER